MAVYAIIGLQGLELIGPKVELKYPGDHYKLSPTVWLVSDAGAAREIGEKLTIANGQLGAQALIVPVGVYFGWGPKGAWDWISTKVSAST